MISYGCINEIGDEDCEKCMVHGFIQFCPIKCPDYDDGRGEEVKWAVREKQQRK